MKTLGSVWGVFLVDLAPENAGYPGGISETTVANYLLGCLSLR